PYRGLEVFQAEHRGLFYGRSLEVRALVERLRGEPLLLCAGDSGVGKSSLCRAGVLPLIEEGALGEGRRWSSVAMVPGRHPVAARGERLAPGLGLRPGDFPGELRARGGALPRRLPAGEGLVIFIDQLEELLTQSEPGEATLVAEGLAGLCARIPGV